MAHDQRKAVLVIDVDDVFWPLNEHVAQIAGVDYNRIITFNALENPLLDESQRKGLYKAYQTPGLHADMDFYPGAREFGVLARDPRLEPWICSNSVDQTVVGNKIRNLAGFLGPDWDLFQKQFTVQGMADAHKKKFPDSVWCAIDDSPHNAISSGAMHILMPRRPWNGSSWGRSVLEPVAYRVRYYDTPADACAIVRRLLDEDFGPPADTE